MATEPSAVAADSIVRLRSAELPQLENLLEANHLPTDDCAEQAGNFYGMFEQGELIAAGGLQPAGDCFVLRSIVVAASHRGRGLARVLTDFLLARAEAAGSPAVYLLTESAADYFGRLGFKAAAREQVPDAVAQTRQFVSICPDNAHCMVIGLPRG